MSQGNTEHDLELRLAQLEKGNRFLIAGMKMLEDLKNLQKECTSLVDSLRENLDPDINDWCNMSRIVEKQHELTYRIRVYKDLYIAILIIENDKDRFEIQKMAQKHFDGTKEYIETLIKIGRTWRFKDYRCRGFMRRLVDFLVEAEALFETETLFE